MKFGLVDGQRQKAQPRLSGVCPFCGSVLIAKCGELRDWHWAHHRICSCDRWWENESDWHRNWKGEFPDDWQEVIHRAEDGEKHIADVKTEHGCIIEFQHSYLRPEERCARESFYPEMVWVVDGLSRKRDSAQFYQALRSGRIVREKPLTVAIPAGEGALLRDWGNSRVPVFFDFGLTDLQTDIFLIETPLLWRVEPMRPDGWAHLAPARRASFIKSLLRGEPFKGIDGTTRMDKVRGMRVAQTMMKRRLCRSRLRV
jgi:hypothetical protein